MSENKTALPYHIGHISLRWIFALAVCIVAMAFGIYGFSQQAIHGLSVTGMRDIGTMKGAPWALYIAIEVYLVGVSFAGITMAAMVRLFNLKELKTVTRMAEFLTIIALVSSTFCILADVGQPLRALINLPRYARPNSPFFGTFTLVVAGYLFSSLVYFYLAGRRDAYYMSQKESSLQWFYKLWAAGYTDTPVEQARHHRTSFWLAIAILPLLVTAHSTLGFVFGLQVGRPGWYGALQGPGFVVLAGISGIGALAILACFVRFVLHESEKINLKIFRWLGNFMLLLLLVYLYFMLVEVLTGVYTGAEKEREVFHNLLFGDYAKLYWATVFFLAFPAALLFFQWLFQKYSIGLVVFCGILVNIGAILKRLVIILPSETHGALLPYGNGHYWPTKIEFFIVIGVFGFLTTLLVIFLKIFPIMEVPGTEEKKVDLEKVKAPWEWGRISFSLLIVIIGFILQFVSYFYLCAPLGVPINESYSNPRIDFAPVIFIAGVMLVFIAAIIYEVLPGGKDAQLQEG